MKRAIAELRGVARWATARVEVLLPALGLPVLFSMVNSLGRQLTTSQRSLVWGMAASYAVLVLWSPMALPVKTPQPVTRAGLRRAARVVIPVVIGATVLMVAMSLLFGNAGAGANSLLRFLSIVVLIIVLGTTGVTAENALPVDLFPVIRRREVRRIVYVIVAALFLAMAQNLWEHIFSGLTSGIGAALGETPPASEDMTSYFDLSRSIGLFVNMLVGAGLFEGLLFRVGIMTLVWALTGRWGWGLVVSSILFGLYHISLSGNAEYFLQAPVSAVLESFGVGLAVGTIYRYRGFTTVVLMHALGNWLMLMLLA